MRITLPGLPHEVMTKFISQVRYSLIWQGFLLPGMTPDWLAASGSTRLALPYDSERKIRELQPSAGLTIRTHQAPFLLVEVVDGNHYVSGLEKGIWTLKNSNGGTKFFVLITLIRNAAKRNGKEVGNNTNGAKASVFHKHQNTGTYGSTKVAENGEPSIQATQANNESENWATTSGSPTGPCSTPQYEADSFNDVCQESSLVATAAHILSTLNIDTTRSSLYDCYKLSL